jgi:acyl carrier protein
MQTMESRAAIRTFVADTFFVDRFADDDSFLQTGIVDSTGMMELVAFIEQAFSIHVEDAEIVPQNLDSLDSICRFIEKKRGF